MSLTLTEREKRKFHSIIAKRSLIVTNISRGPGQSLSIEFRSDRIRILRKTPGYSWRFAEEITQLPNELSSLQALFDAIEGDAL